MTKGLFPLSEADLDFLIRAVAPDVSDKSRLHTLLATDEDFRDAFIGDENTFKKIIADKETFLRISPRLYFEVLLRKTRRDLEATGYTIEKSGQQKIAVFDAQEVNALLAKQEILSYLSDMLASFIKVETYTLTYRVREGIWRRVKFSDLDIDSLITFCELVEEQHRLGFFKRIADICLFVVGLFPDYVQRSLRYRVSSELRAQLPGWLGKTVDEYEQQGKLFYELAAEHPAARTGQIAEVFDLLHENFNTAKKPLNFLAEHYLHFKRSGLFDKGRSN